MITLAEFMTISENSETRKKKYEELSAVEKLQADYDLKATNIVLQGLPPDVYAIDNHHKVAKVIWDRVKLLMQGTSLSLQKRECKLYDEFDKFTHVKGETLYQYYCRFAQLINDTHHQHNNETSLSLTIPVFNLGNDQIACLNKAMAFMSAVVALRFPSTNNQLRTSSNLRNQANIQDGGQAKAVKCYNCQGERHMDRQCTQPKRPRNATWFKEKAMLAEAQESGQILDEEQLAFLVEPRIIDCHDVQPTIIHNAAFQTDDLDAYISTVMISLLLKRF
ncbi:retrovirus-related pol polyprotein from transposon TNT 1-94 [Tanacetum coccineum]|uniref:Retrovirus-related pol polyprotein from transposon TNT 1-94 n=1 Tax=Tanacetum coccineum TaxID=301880 RepID=A0ABQ4ZQ04_9ASTR